MTVQLSPNFYRDFLAILIAEIGLETTRLLLNKASLSLDVLDLDVMSTVDASSAAVNYANIQLALRSYFGRGTRGTLLRVGRLLFQHQYEKLGLVEKTRAVFIKLLPASLRSKQALDFAASLLQANAADVSTHTLDLDLLLVDRTSPSTTGQKEAASICFVTQGFIQESLYWALGREQDVDEIHCRATGHATCEFRVSIRE